MSQTNSSQIPAVESPSMAFLLALIAGCLNGFTYHKIKAFSTLQSGNLILLGDSIAMTDWDHLTKIIAVTIAFGLGSMTTAFIAYKELEHKRIWSYSILITEAMILAIIATGILNEILSITHICLIISFIAGMQGNAFHKVKGMTYGNVAMTPVVQAAFNYLMIALFGRLQAWLKSMVFFYVVIGFALGGLVGTIMTAYTGEKSLLSPAFILILIFIRLLYEQKRYSKPIDSTYN
ncbi:YoaK family protein [Ignatzschineria larvae DSM 13226]|uniref:YoaK family protein n=1 Tax=Ignatzschineria larvae DSM 13226 TaxID=1111732 RepID=A0ABZ3C4M8_9GAMM|nr:YoaK family protein [Ignatzschineria larvae]